MIPRTAQWRINPYVLGLVLNAPPDVTEPILRTFAEAEVIAARNCAQDTPAERAIHATWVTYSADHARIDGNELLAEWLDQAAVLLTEDWGVDARDDLARSIAEDRTT